MERNRKRAIGLSVMLLIPMCGLYLVGRVPEQDGPWQVQYRVLPDVSVAGDVLAVRNVRDFRYNDDGTVKEFRYLDNEYFLSELKDVWFGISHFGDYGFAHAFASFEFSNGDFLVVSIEARLREDQKSYGPVDGAFRNYTKFIVLATEQDVIGLRSHIRKEPVYLYRLKGSMLQARALLLNYMRHAEMLIDQPEFYNTLTDNCLTGLLAESGRYGSIHDWLDYRILLPGYSDDLLLENGFIVADAERVGAGGDVGEVAAGGQDIGREIDDLRARSRIDPNGTSLQDGAFSINIRR